MQILTRFQQDSQPSCRENHDEYLLPALVITENVNQKFSS